MCNELVRLSHGWGKYSGTDTIEFILNKDKPKFIRETYVRAVCDIRSQKTESHRTRLTAGGNRIDYPVQVSTSTSDITTIKVYVNSAIYDITLIYICMKVKYYHLENHMYRSEYMMIHIFMISQEILGE